MSKPKRTNKTQTQTPAAVPEFVINEYYETLLRRKRDNPECFRRSLSALTQRCVEIYEQMKKRAGKRAA